MNSRASRLQPAVEQAHKRQQDALTRLAEQQQSQARVEQQLADLRRYREEYAMPCDGALTVTELVNRQHFVERIDQAISQQQQELLRQQRLLDSARLRWREAHAREKALGSVVQRYQEQERKSEDRREQAAVDERMQYRRPLR